MKRTWKTRFLLAGTVAVGMMAIGGPADAAEYTSNEDASASITSGPLYVVSGYRPTFTYAVSVYKNHKIVNATVSKDCTGSLGTMLAKSVTTFSCTMNAAVAYPGNDYFDIRISGTGKTWPYLGSGHTSTLDLSRKLTVINPKLSVSVTAPDGRYFDGESTTPYANLYGKITVTNTGDTALKYVSLAGTGWTCDTAIAASLAVGASSSVNCYLYWYTPWGTATLNGTATGYPDVSADPSQLFPSTYSTSATGSVTFQDDIDLTAVRVL